MSEGINRKSVVASIRSWITPISTFLILVVTTYYTCINNKVLKTMEKTSDMELRYNEISLIPYISFEIDSIPWLEKQKFTVHYKLLNKTKNPALRLRHGMAITDEMNDVIKFIPFDSNEVYTAMYPDQVVTSTKHLYDEKYASYIFAGKAYLKIRVDYDDIVNNHWSIVYTFYIKFSDQRTKTNMILFKYSAGIQSVEFMKTNEKGEPLEVLLQSTESSA